MTRKGIPDCPELNPEHDGFGSAKLFRGDHYGVEESYSYEFTTTSYDTNNDEDEDDFDENEDDFDEDEGYVDKSIHYQHCNFNNSNVHLNINVTVDLNNPDSVNKLLELMKKIKELDAVNKN